VVTYLRSLPPRVQPDANQLVKILELKGLRKSEIQVCVVYDILIIMSYCYC